VPPSAPSASSSAARERTEAGLESWLATDAATARLPGLDVIDVLVGDADEVANAMRSVSENLVRVSMNSVDIWGHRGAGRAGLDRKAIADALALPARTVRRLKLLRTCCRQCWT